MPFFVRLLVNGAALWVATRLVPGVSYNGGWVPFFGVALVFGVINAVLRPIAKILTFPIILVTLGIFSFVVNGGRSNLVLAYVAVVHRVDQPDVHDRRQRHVVSNIHALSPAAPRPHLLRGGGERLGSFRFIAPAIEAERGLQ